MRSLLIAGDATSDARVESVVTFARHAEWELFLPSEMSEIYDVPSRPDGFCVIGSAKSSNSRRFQVTTDEQIKVPKHE